jgi:hypothetical protein
MNKPEEIKESDREHFMQCSSCEEWFDMRDLGQVLDHEHWLTEKPPIHFSHVKKKGKLDEVYIKRNGRIITLKSGKPKVTPRYRT